MHSNCNAPLDLSRFLVLSFPPRRRCTRARVYTLPHDSCSLLFHDKSVGLCAARITYHCLPVGKYYSNRMPRGVTIMFSFATNPIARPHRFERVGASKELQECEKRDERDVWKFAVDDFVGRRKGLFVPFKRMNMKRNFISNARYKWLVSSEIVYSSIVVKKR